MRGNNTRRKKELLIELAELENMEESQVLYDDLYAVKSFVEGQLLHLYEEEKFWHMRSGGGGCYRVMPILISFIKLPMEEPRRNDVYFKKW